MHTYSCLSSILPSRASLVAQPVKNPSAVQEDPLEEGMAIHSSMLAWRNSIDRRAWLATVHGATKSQT